MPRLKFFTTLNFAIQFFSFRFIYVDFETRRFERQFFSSSIFIVTYLVTLSSWCLRKLNFPERFDYSLKMIWRCDSKRMNMHKQSYRQKFNNRIRTVCEWERWRHPKEIVLSSRSSPYDFFLFFFSVTSFSLSGMVGFRLSPMMMTTFLFASHYQADDFKGIFFSGDCCSNRANITLPFGLWHQQLLHSFICDAMCWWRRGAIFSERL